MDNNLLIVPCGKPITFHDAYDKENHWRFTNKEKRLYKTLLVMYNDFEPEENSYDFKIKIDGKHKWEKVRDIPDVFDLSPYHYIGCIDDDQITDIWNMNRGLEMARRFDFKFWQLSMLEGSSIWYDCLKQNKEWDFSETNFIEMGNCQFRFDIFQDLQKLLHEWKEIGIAYGLDKVFTDFLGVNPNVVHNASIFHPYHESYYDKNKAMIDMHRFLYTEYPEIVKNLKGRESRFTDVQQTVNAFIIER